MREASGRRTATVSNPTLFYIIIHPNAQGFCRWNLKQTKQKMKRFITLIVAICAIFSAMAQNQLATLSHEGELTFFTSLSAFEDALKAAVDGDIIYLSEGNFTSAKTTIEINKRISIVGCGYGSHIVSDLKVDMGYNSYVEGQSVSFDGVKLEKLDFMSSANSIANVREVRITNSWIRKLARAGNAGNYLSIDRCYIDIADFYNYSNTNILVKNSKLYKISTSGGTSYVSINLINCNVGISDVAPKSFISSILYKSATISSGIEVLSGTSNCIFINSLFPNTTITGDAVTENCYYDANSDNSFFDDNMDCTLDLTEKGYLGQDGTVIGVYGGDFPFSEYPSVPSVDSANSSVTYDAENNKLNVTIKVTPN